MIAYSALIEKSREDHW